MILTKPQAYALVLLADFRGLRVEQIQKLLAARFGTTSAQVEALLRQLCVGGKVMLHDGLALLPGRTVNPVVLRAFDVMLALTDGTVSEVMPGSLPFVMIFTVPEENGAESVFGVVDGANPRATGIAGIGKDVTVLFMLTDSDQSKEIHTKNKHYFALSDKSGHVRFFTNT